MKPASREWVKKAEGDFETAKALIRRRKVLADAICFHCQQSVEKYLKARLEEACLHVPKTHDCGVLLNALLALEPLWAPWMSTLARLSDYAVRLRYPGVYATKSEAKQAVKDCKAIRTEVRHSLGLR
jgi:HEPN domain-containing protein